MTIAYTSRNRRPEAPYPYFASAAALAPRSTSSVVITPGAPELELIDASVLAALGKKGYLVNVARGSVVDEQALVKRSRAAPSRVPARRVRERAERSRRAARARQRRPPPRRQRDLADTPGDGRPRLRQPRGALRRPAAALAGAA